VTRYVVRAEVFQDVNGNEQRSVMTVPVEAVSAQSALVLVQDKLNRELAAGRLKRFTALNLSNAKKA
jgi:hypothetical protein